jgi:hypothetical protein
MKWLDDVLPDNEQWHKFARNFDAFKMSLRDSIEIGEL